MQYLFVLGQILVGGYFIMAGYNHFKNLAGMTGYAQSKGIMMPKQSVMLTGLMLILGGLGILLGVYVKVAIALLVVFLISTLVKMHTFWTVTDPMARMGEEINFKKNLALIGALLMLLQISAPWAICLIK